MLLRICTCSLYEGFGWLIRLSHYLLSRLLELVNDRKNLYSSSNYLFAFFQRDSCCWLESWQRHLSFPDSRHGQALSSKYRKPIAHEHQLAFVRFYKKWDDISESASYMNILPYKSSTEIWITTKCVPWSMKMTWTRNFYRCSFASQETRLKW